MKLKLLFSVFLALFAFNFSFAQYSDVQITVVWNGDAFENKLEVYNTSNDLIATICDDSQCYVSSQQGVTNRYGSKYDLGCVANGNNYYIKLYDVANDGWTSSSYVSVVVAGTQVINNNGSGANTSGHNIYFNVSGGDANCSAQPDTDGDGIIDNLDYDDDADGISDSIENLGENRFECTLPELAFENGVYDAAASSGAIDTVGAVYRFSNSIQGYDILMEITELTNTTISNIDDDSVDTPSNLQTALSFSGTGTPGATFNFTIVNAGTTTPSTEIFRVNGITWDCDGSGSLKESVIYYDPAAYGTENPTSLEVLNLGGGDIQISASGLQEGPGFSDLKVLRAYYQFVGNSFSMRMQAIKTSSGTTTRQFGMSFTQCQFLDFNANSLNIVRGEDTDGDGFFNHLDIDADNDGIPDNIEGQPTVGYILPSGTIDPTTGIDLAYGSGIYPQDTDNDKIPDFIDSNSDNDGYTDIQENGMADTFTAADVDDDGLNNAFETSGVNDAIWDVNEDIEDPTDLSILPDDDGDLMSGGDLDYRDLFSPNPPPIASIDFDGVDDYLSRDAFIDGLSNVTLMVWVKSDSGNSTDMVIAGEDSGCKLWLENGNIPKFTVKTAGNSEVTVTCSSINLNEWHHITGTYNSTTGAVSIFVDGKSSGSATVSNTGAVIENTEDSNGSFEVGRLSTEGVADHLHFKGDIDEIRVFDVALTQSQISQMVYQEIEQSGGKVRGKVVLKPIHDISSNNTVAWSNLIAYYPMTNIVTGRTEDYSSYDNMLYINFIETAQDQTAPMPYQATNSGSWSSESTWAHGDVWDIEDPTSVNEYGIVQISNNVTINEDISFSSLVIDSGATFTVESDHALENTWYINLNGTIDLLGDSQLIQTETSDLMTGSYGKLLRRQEGVSNPYWYNYWASPVGSLRATSYKDNNTSTNNTNNSSFTLLMLKDESGANMNFTTDYTPNGRVSTFWLYTYINGLTYYDWASITKSTAISPGIGYTQKGTGAPLIEQQYIFEGKPNNGTILVDVEDRGGAGSVAGTSKTEFLLGNPYPSALDVHAFIDDNAGVIDGTLQLWQQWSGNSHNLEAYNGGYAQINKTGAVRASQFVGLEGATTGGLEGTKVPTRYLPVAQGFITEIVANGTVEFNNGQRIFIKESDANGNYSNGSVFMKGDNKKAGKSGQSKSNDSKPNSLQKIRLEFKSVTGPNTKRELLLGFSEFTTDGYDYGYEAETHDAGNNDLNLSLDGKNMNIQAYGQITPDKVVPLNFRSSGDHTFEIHISELENTPAEQDIYLRDNLTGDYFNLREGQPYRFVSEQGIFNQRLELVFQNKASTLSVEEANTEENYIYYDKNNNILFAKKLVGEVKRFALYSITGQVVMELADVERTTLSSGLQLPNMASGTYIAVFRTDTDSVITKKLVAN
ncbi:Por secretion system C-terminal sorting domain-containing protein [Hyunsoonleella jejuensis]|uniref:Por secretion system C-terminal sorting domain-containing protein n=1 Tax=Hyunsoonleella jejuensis TaxID=419940 RepID=A0A1H9BMS7_9FLAO|nr:LamG domain-containing protein [Hyunsoonleella jejuensis]SEP89843.1 Por secretion system C-terminal sorting domain-containing protein [Hyunsoonleella jejuensis]